MDPLIKLNFVIQGYVPNASDRILQGTISLNDLTYMTNFLIMSLLFIEFSNFCIMTILIIESIDIILFIWVTSYFCMNTFFAQCHAFYELNLLIT